MLDEMERASAWNPDAQKMSTYQEREVRLACSNIRRLQAAGMTRIAPEDVLCSGVVFRRAMDKMRSETEDPKRTEKMRSETEDPKRTEMLHEQSSGT